MALKTSIEILLQKRDGRSIIVKDDTGLVKFGRPNGYTEGDINNILKYIYTVSRVFDSVTYKFIVDGSEELLPTPRQLAWGHKLELTTGLFKTDTERGVTEPSEIFEDGLLNIDQYTVFRGQDNVVIGKGTNFIYGGDGVFFHEDLKADSIIVNNEIYQIDKSMFDNGGSIIYITGQFKDDSTVFDVAYRANAKAMLISMSENMHGYACSLLRNQLDHPDWQKINTAQAFRRAAQGFFSDQDSPDYAKADDLVQASYKLLSKFSI